MFGHSREGSNPAISQRFGYSKALDPRLREDDGLKTVPFHPETNGTDLRASLNTSVRGEPVEP